MHPHELFRQVREWVVWPVQVSTHAYIGHTVLTAAYVYPEMQLGVPRRLGIVNAINFRPLPKAWRDVLSWVAAHLSLTRVDVRVAT